MISLKKYLDSTQTGPIGESGPDEGDSLPAAIAAYRSALIEIGNCSLNACPVVGEELKRSLGRIEENLSVEMSSNAIMVTEKRVQEQLRNWGQQTARRNCEKTSEVKALLIVMAHTAESVGERDERCAGQINEVTARLEGIASLDDLTEIRVSIEKSASELKASVERMAAEGKAAIAELRAQVSSYQVKLEEAEEIASRDALTGLRSRLWIESQMEQRIDAGVPLSVAIADIDGFKKVNDEHGHLVGDELLKQFATELQSACRSTDLIGRWGGDEFIILLDCGMHDAKAKVVRLREWVCGDYKVPGRSGSRKLHVDASIGVAEMQLGETLKDLLDRADADMYEQKGTSRAKRNR